MDLIAQKSFRYRGRALKPDDAFTAERRHGKVLVAAGRAREPRAELGTYQAPAPSPRTKRKPMDDDGNGSNGGSRRQEPSAELSAARKAYTAETGKRCFSGWSLEEINAKIAQHQALAQSQSENADQANQQIAEAMAQDQERPVTDPKAAQDADQEADALAAAGVESAPAGDKLAGEPATQEDAGE